MNNDISTMIELQHFWDNVMKSESETERCKKSIKTWESRLKEMAAKASDTDGKVKSLKMALKKYELDLEETDSKIKRVEQRKSQLKSEREVEAQNNELILLSDAKSKLEETVIELIDDLEKLETEMNVLKKELSESEKQVKSDIEKLNNKITEYQKEADLNKGRFNDLLPSLSPEIRSRFSKLISSKDGVAISQLKGETCSRCNFQVPSSIALSASTRKKVETCTNCGRFIY